MIPRWWIVLAVAVLLVAAGAVGLKVYADRSAAEQVEDRVEEIEEMLVGSTPEDFLAFNSGRKVEGSVAAQVADQPDFVSVDARAAQAVIRFQPKGWWAGFTERCIVAVVRSDGPVVEAPKTACVRVDPAGY